MKAIILRVVSKVTEISLETIVEEWTLALLDSMM